MNYAAARKGDQTGRGGRGGGRGGCGFSQYQNREATSTSSKFEGHEPKLKGHIFDCRDFKTVEAFYKTMDEILQHIQTDFKQGEEVVRLLRVGKKLELTTFLGARPTDTTNPEYEIEKDIYSYEIKSYVESKTVFESNLKKAYGLIYGQCSPNLDQNLQTQQNWEDIDSRADVLGLMDMMKSLIFKYDDNKHPYHSLSKAVVDFHWLYQKDNQRDEDFLKEFKAAYEVVHLNGGLLGGHPTLIMRKLHEAKRPFAEYDASIWTPEPSDVDYAGGRASSRVPLLPNIMGKKMVDEDVTPKELKRAVDEAEESFLAMCLLCQANKERHGHIMTHLKNAFTLGNDKFPETVTEAYNLLLHMKNSNNTSHGGYRNSGGNDGLTFVTHGNGGDDDDSVKPWHSEMTCYNCGERGHVAKFCPKKKKNQEKAAEKHAVNAYKEEKVETKLAGLPSVIGGELVNSNGGESKSTDSLPGKIPPMQRYDPVTGKALLTILEAESDDNTFKHNDKDVMEEFNFHVKSTGGDVPSSWLLLDS